MDLLVVNAVLGLVVFSLLLYKAVKLKNITVTVACILLFIIGCLRLILHETNDIDGIFVTPLIGLLAIILLEAMNKGAVR